MITCNFADANMTSPCFCAIYGAQLMIEPNHSGQSAFLVYYPESYLIKNSYTERKTLAASSVTRPMSRERAASGLSHPEGLRCAGLFLPSLFVHAEHEQPKDRHG